MWVCLGVSSVYQRRKKTVRRRCACETPPLCRSREQRTPPKTQAVFRARVNFSARACVNTTIMPKQGAAGSTPMRDQAYQDMAHLLRRAGFGASSADITAVSGRGVGAVTDDLLHPERTPDTTNDADMVRRLASLVPEDRRTNKRGDVFLPLQTVKMWWVQRMIASPHPLVEKMTLFWHGHFTSKDGNQQGDFMMRQNQLFRANALGNFRTLTQAVSRDPEMLRYLNGSQNYKAHPNENYGRELMELYTCGIGNYTEDDVKAAARAFSGWNLRGGEFVFNANNHDNDPKTFLGKTGNWNGDDIVDILVAHPATAARLCRQLFAFFAYPNPEQPVLNALVQTYYSSGYDLRAVVGTILRSRAFYSDKARYGLIKSPAQYVVGTVKMMGLDKAFTLQPGDITPANDMASNPGAAPANATDQQRQSGRRLGVLASLPLAMRSMGQDLLEPPSVKGWDGNEAWINTSTLLARINFANLMSQSRLAFGGEFARATDFVQEKGFSAGQYVDFLAETLGPLPLSAQTRQTIVDYINQPDAAPANGALTGAQAAVSPADLPRFGRGKRQAGNLYARVRARTGAGGMEARLRAALPLVMATPEYQVC